MSMHKFAELNLYRVRGYNFIFNSDLAYDWVLERDGGFLRLHAGGGGPWTVTLGINAPALPLTGTRLWVEFYQGGAGSSLISWPANAKFQTVGDAVPAAAMGSTTIWTGIFGVASVNLFMTKLGEWP